jgi:hypothetical protein
MATRRSTPAYASKSARLAATHAKGAEALVARGGAGLAPAHNVPGLATVRHLARLAAARWAAKGAARSHAR